MAGTKMAAKRWNQWQREHALVLLWKYDLVVWIRHGGQGRQHCLAWDGLGVAELGFTPQLSQLWYVNFLFPNLFIKWLVIISGLWHLNWKRGLFSFSHGLAFDTLLHLLPWLQSTFLVFLPRAALLVLCASCPLHLAFLCWATLYVCSFLSPVLSTQALVTLLLILNEILI